MRRSRGGEDVTDWISTEGTIAVSIVSFLTRRPDRRGIELLGRLLLSEGVIQLQQRLDDLHFASAHERYQKLMTDSPSLINRVPLGRIVAGYELCGKYRYEYLAMGGADLSGGDLFLFGRQ